MAEAKRKRRLAFSIVAIVASLALIEVAFVLSGVLIPQAFRDRRRLLHEFFEPDPILGFRARPNLREFAVEWSESGERGVYSTDAEGFRDLGRDVREARILFLGDSFTWGVWLPREQTFPDLIEQGLGVPIANWSRESYYIEQYALLADRFLDAYDPDVVAICIYANDLTAPISSAQLADFYAAFGWNDFQRYPLSKRTLAFQAWRRISRTLEDPDTAESHLDFKLAPNGLRLYRGIGAHPHYELAGYDEAFEKNYSALIRGVKAAGATPIVFLLPSKESTYALDYASLFDAYYLEIEQRAFANLVALAENEGVLGVDLTDALRQQARVAPAYLAIDPHWNAAGHRAAARRMEAHLRGALGLPAP